RSSRRKARFRLPPPMSMRPKYFSRKPLAAATSLTVRLRWFMIIGGSSALEIVPHIAIEQRDAEPGRPRGVDLVGRRPERDARDIEMGPRHLPDEAGEKLRGGDRAGGPATGVLDVGETALDLLFVSGPHRHAPELFAGREPGRDAPRRQLVIVGEQSRVVAAERHADGAGEG